MELSSFFYNHVNVGLHSQSLAISNNLDRGVSPAPTSPSSTCDPDSMSAVHLWLRAINMYDHLYVFMVNTRRSKSKNDLSGGWGHHSHHSGWYTCIKNKVTCRTCDIAYRVGVVLKHGSKHSWARMREAGDAPAKSHAAAGWKKWRARHWRG
jgi:hypothetical protein